MARFFVDYIYNDLLGNIANAHLATADSRPEVRVSAPCIAPCRVRDVYAAASPGLLCTCRAELCK